MGHPFLNIKPLWEYNLITGVNPLLDIGENRWEAGRKQHSSWTQQERKWKKKQGNRLQPQENKVRARRGSEKDI